MRRLLVASIMLAVTACGGSGGSTTTTDAVEDLRRSIAADYGESAARALEATRYEGLGAEGIMDLVLDACDRLGSTSPDAAVADALAGLDVPAGEALDDSIAEEVLVEGLATVCPDDVLRASGIDPAAPTETDRDTLFLGAVAPFADSAGFSFSDDELIVAGNAVCGELEGGSDPESAILVGLNDLFGIDAISLADVGDAGENEGLLLGAVLGSASVYFCPAHAERVAVFVQSGDLG
jgi:hypothetical protein